MNIEEALQVADKVADRESSWAEHPSMVNMIYALEILAADYRTAQGKAQEWEASSNRMTRRAMDATTTRDQAVREGRELNTELRRAQGQWSNLTEFIRTALNLDAGVALDDVGDVRKILGREFAASRILARVRDEVNGKFVAGSVVTADAVNTAQDAAAEPEVPKGYTTRVTHEGVWSAPVGTDPADRDKWTRLGDATDFTVNMKLPKVTDYMTGCQYFSVGAPEPDARVKRVRRLGSGMELVRAGHLSTGGSLWRCVGDDSDVFHLWPAIVKWGPGIEVADVSAPAVQTFPAYAPEPSAQVTHVRRFPASDSRGYAASTFTRVGKTTNGLSIWHEDAQPDSTILWAWPDVVRNGAEEIRR